MRASRLLALLLRLQLQRRVSAGSLAEEFEVSVRTIYRDIDELSAAGVPVYAERGRNGGVSLDEGYRTKLTGLTPSEAESLLFLGASGAAADLGLGAALVGARLKLLAGLPPEQGARAANVGARFHLDPFPWYSRGADAPFLTDLAAAVWRERRVRIEYESWDKSFERTIDPLGLVLKGGLWYLVASAKGALRTYRVSNIRKLEVLDAAARRPTRFRLDRYWRDSAAEFESRLFSRRARVRLSARGLRLLRDTLPIAAAAFAAERPNTDGWLEGDMPVEDGEGGVLQLLRLGRDVEVLAPAELRKAVQRTAAAVASMHGGKD